MSNAVDGDGNLSCGGVDHYANGNYTPGHLTGGGGDRQGGGSLTCVAGCVPRDIPKFRCSRCCNTAVALVVSGGHTSLFYVRDYDAIETLGVTTDDAAGEAFDKVASILDLGYPGGPAVDRTAEAGDPRAVDFPRSMLAPDSLDFSFSGIKTAVLYHVHGHGRTSGGLERLSRQDVADITASFQQAVVDVLARKTLLAVEKTGVRTVVAGGGVTANRALRRRLEQDCREAGVTLHLPPMGYCTDNAAMVAALGYHLFGRGRISDLSISAMT